MRSVPIAASILILLAGCATPGPSGSVDGEQALAQLLPAGIALADGEELSRNATAVTFRWAGSFEGPFAAGAVTPPQATQPRSTLTLPSTVPLSVEAILAPIEGADVLLRIQLADGSVLCEVEPEEPCRIAPVEPSGWEREWTLVIARLETTRTELQHDVTVRVESLPGGSREPRARVEVAEMLPFEAVADDGVVLRGHVYLPEGDGPFATILSFSPYWDGFEDASDGLAVERDGRRTLAGRWGPFTDAGFAFAAIAIRGTGTSGGCVQWFEPLRDGQDARAVIEALAAEPWSNGAVGMVGVSWPGYTQWAALTDPPPALKAVAPASAIVDVWSLYTRNGATVHPDNQGWTGFDTQFHALFAAGDPLEVEGNVERLACPDLAEHEKGWLDLDASGDRTAYSEARDSRALLANTKVPAYVSNGLKRDGHILQVVDLWDILGEGAQHRFVLGQWDHGFPQGAMADTYNGRLLDWFDHHLRGAPEQVPGGVVEYQDDTGAWHTASAWPPPPAANASGLTQLFLSAAMLVASAEEVVASEQAVHTARAADVVMDPHPNDCAGLEAVFVSAPLAEPIALAGEIEVTLTIEATTDDATVAVHLWHGPEIVACSDRAGADDVEPVATAQGDLRHRGGALPSGASFPLAKPTAITLRGDPFASVIPAGDRLFLAIGSSAWRLQADLDQGPYVLRTGPNVAASVTLPVVDGRLVFA